MLRKGVHPYGYLSDFGKFKDILLMSLSIFLRVCCYWRTSTHFDGAWTCSFAKGRDRFAAGTDELEGCSAARRTG